MGIPNSETRKFYILLLSKNLGMEKRRFGKTNWEISELGYGMWGLAGWTGSDQDEVQKSLELSVELGCNFFDTAWGYAEGKSE